MGNRPKTLSIREASHRTGLPAHTLRFWEYEMKGILRPLRTKGGQRRYGPEHLRVITRIKRLKEKGLSLDDVRREFDMATQGERYPDPDQERIDLLADRVADAVRSMVYRFLRKEVEKDSEEGPGNEHSNSANGCESGKRNPGQPTTDN